MAVYQKSHVEPYLKELETYYRNVRRAVEGEKPSPNLADKYRASPDDFARDYAEIDMDLVERELGRFMTTVQFLKQLKKLAAEKAPTNI